MASKNFELKNPESGLTTSLPVRSGTMTSGLSLPWCMTRSALPLRQSATTAIRPPGASSVRWVLGSCIGRMPASSSTVATQMAFEPDIGGVSSGSMMMNPICARGSLAGTSRLTWRKTPPRGSLSTKARSAPSLAMNRDCSHNVSPGGAGTPPTITSPTSPSAWQETMWMSLEVRMGADFCSLTLGFAFALSEICHLWPMAVNAMTSRLSRHENDALFRRAGFTQATVHQANGAKPRYRRRCGARDNRMAEFAIGDGFSTPRTENLVYCGS